jgi:hypothetical protein
MQPLRFTEAACSPLSSEGTVGQNLPYGNDLAIKRSAIEKEQQQLLQDEVDAAPT